MSYYIHDLSPFLIKFSENFGIRYYGIAYLLGFAVFYWGMFYQIKQGWCKMPAGAVENFVTWTAIAGVIVGGRLGYCLLYEFEHTLRNPLSIFEIWHGGMASHGGIIGVIIVMFVYAKKCDIPFFNIADAAALFTPVGFGLGRIANFINAELWGRETTVPWAVIFPNARPFGSPRHPSQLYEAFLEGVALFAILWIVRKKTKQDGMVSVTFIGAYGILRIIGECFREPDPQIGYYFGHITQGQILSALLVVVAATLYCIIQKMSRKKCNI